MSELPSVLKLAIELSLGVQMLAFSEGLLLTNATESTLTPPQRS